MFNIYEALSSGVGKAILAVICGAVSIAIGMALESYEDQPQGVEYAVIPVGESHEIVVTGPDQQIGGIWVLMFSIRQDGQPVLEDGLLGATKLEPWTLKFELVPSGDDDLIGLVESNFPDRLLLTWRLSNNQGWPQSGLPSDAGIQGVSEQVDQLNKSNPGRSFVHMGLIRFDEAAHRGYSEQVGAIW